ncbi:MAG: DUF86 domain-containing protein [Clostridiales bacterium]|nr:DUF86 domain-containing protein [Clostridiales bacterium]
MIDKGLIKGRLLLIDDYITQLESLSQMPISEFLSDRRNAAAAESFLRRSLEAIFDIGRHILAKTGGINMATEYKAIARGLGERNVVSKDLSQKLIQMAGYRNRMVHMYHIIAEDELYNIITEDLNDIREFVVSIKKYLTTF